MVLLLIAFLDALGKPGWWAILFFIPIANLVVWIMLAFEKSGGQTNIPENPTPPETPAQ